jgi:hypothetical protein
MSVTGILRILLGTLHRYYILVYRTGYILVGTGTVIISFAAGSPQNCDEYNQCEEFHFFHTTLFAFCKYNAH